MRAYRRWAAGLAAGFLFLVALCSCGGGTITPEEERQIQQYGQQFLEDLKGIVPYKDDSEALIAMDAVAQVDDRGYNLSRLYQFCEDWQAGKASQLTAIFKSQSFVVVRLAFDGERGYYLRYEFDKFNEADITISSQVVNGIALTEDEKLDKVEVALSRARQDNVVLTFRNLVPEEDGAAEDEAAV